MWVGSYLPICYRQRINERECPTQFTRWQTIDLLVCPTFCRFVNTQERKHSIMKKVTSSGHLVIILIIIHLSFGRSSFLSIIGLFVCLSICSFILSLSLSLLVLIEIWGNLKWKQKVDTKFSLQIEVSHPLTICLITSS